MTKAIFRVTKSFKIACPTFCLVKFALKYHKRGSFLNVRLFVTWKKTGKRFPEGDKKVNIRW